MNRSLQLSVNTNSIKIFWFLENLSLGILFMLHTQNKTKIRK